MSEIFPKDLLLRCGGRTLQRYGVLAVAGSRRGPVELPVTCSRADATSCAAEIDRDGIVRLAAANVPRVEWWDLDGDGIFETSAVLPEGGGTNSWLWSDDQSNGAWTNNGIASVGTGDPDPAGGTSACHTIENTVNTSHIVGQNFSGATDNTLQTVLFHAKAKTRTWAALRSFDKAGVAKFSYVNLATGAKGTIDAAHKVAVRPLASGWYRITLTFNCNSGASTPSAWIGGATGDLGIIFTGDGASGIYVWRGHYEKNSGVVGAPIKTTTVAVTRAADTYSTALSFGPQALTIYTRHIEAQVLDATARGVLHLGATGVAQRILEVNWSGAFYRVTHGDGGTGFVEASAAAAPASGSLVELASCLYPDGHVSIEQAINSVTAAVVTTATPKPLVAWGSQIAYLGRRDATLEFFNPINDAFVARGVHTLSECQAVP